MVSVFRTLKGKSRIEIGHRKRKEKSGEVHGLDFLYWGAISVLANRRKNTSRNRCIKNFGKDRSEETEVRNITINVKTTNGIGGNS